jgi:signal transduction histidine kinase
MEELEILRNKLRQLEMELEEVKSLSRTQNKLLVAHIKELNDTYSALKEKLDALREKNERIKTFEDQLMKANKLSSLGELASSIAHEIKNPLISIQGFARRIGELPEHDKVEKYARLIEKESARLSSVLTKLLEFSRMDIPHKEIIDINTLVDDTVTFMEHYLTRFKNVKIVLEKAENLPLVSVDKIHIQQVLVNIIMNAAQAMTGGGTIRINTDHTEGMVSISVRDEGTGIKKEDIDRIFEPFFTTKQKSEGTGLGLSLSKRLVEANEGTITVESQPGKGSCFTILLPGVEA